MIQIYLKLRKSNKYNNINNNKQISRKLSHFKKKPIEKTCCVFMKKDL